MPFTFTAYDEVRALLGVDVKELPDSVLQGAIFTNQLKLEIFGVSADIEADYLAAKLESTVPATNFVAVFDVFASYAMAKYCLDGLPQFSPKAVASAKSSFTRYSDSPYLKVIERVEGGYLSFKRKLAELYGTYKGVAVAARTPQVLVGVSPLATNPVTGE